MTGATSSVTPLVVDGIGAGYRRGVPVLHDVSFELRPGVTALLGVNGAGKSTLLRTLVGDLSSWSGRITGLGEGGTTALPRERTGFLTQNPSLPTSLRVEDVVTYAGWLKALSWQTARSATDEALAAVNLLEQRQVRVRALSGGMRRRLAIAAAIVHRPDIVVLDEPTASLDPVQCMEIRALLRRISASRVVLVSTHLLGDVAFAADAVVVLHEGRVRFTGPPAELAALGGGSPEDGVGETLLERGFLKVISRDPSGNSESDSEHGDLTA